MSSGKKHRVHLEVTYFIEIPVPADNEEEAVIEIEKYLAKSDDYEIVNRADNKQYRIDKIVRLYPETK